MAGEFQEKKLYHLLKLRSDQTDSVSVDLHQRRLDADGVPFSFDHTCGRLRGREKKSRHSKIVRYRRQSATTSPLESPRKFPVSSRSGSTSCRTPDANSPSAARAPR
jgi:hypothetical protein